MRAGDVVDVEIERIGVLSNPIVEEGATREQSAA
jgi:2-keto-4-pentenoate hydratase/2-oxohepta-3-ene-1,7-dioic acid hydratase in catechol pathway